MISLSFFIASMEWHLNESTLDATELKMQLDM